MNIQKSLAFLYTNNKRLEKETIPFIIKSKRIKYLGINLPKYAKHLFSKNYKMLMKKITDGRYIMFLDWKNHYCQNDYTTQGNPQFQCNPYQITCSIFIELEQNI